VPQDVPPQLADKTVREALHRSLDRIGQGDDWWRIDVLLDVIGVAPGHPRQEFGEMSGGWQRLMLIAAAARLEEPDI
jgi:ATPase subunit of ABC transporter with duplicated ATPase domains